MKLKVIFLSTALIVLIVFLSFQKTPKDDFDNFSLVASKQQSIIAQKVSVMMQNWHYKKQALNDSISKIICKNYINFLDSGRFYLLKKDIEAFKKYEYNLDDALLNGNLQPFFDLFNIYIQRYKERYEYFSKIIDKDFNFNLDQYYYYDLKKIAKKKKKDLDKLWYQKIKYEMLALKLDSNNVQRNRKLLKDRYKNQKTRIFQTNTNDVFNLIMNAFSNVIDPHSSYIGYKKVDEFNIKHSLSYAGIGATLSLRDNITTVVGIFPKGPAGKGKEIQNGDRIIAVAQEGKDFVDIIGWRLDDVVAIIRGEKDSKVTLKIIPKGETLASSPKKIVIQRDIIVLEDKKAKGKIISKKLDDETQEDFKVGYIDLPSFYFDFKAAKAKSKNVVSTTRDVRALIDSLKTENMQGLIIDLRNNGGGSLKEAIDLTGLFIPKGPVVQIKDVRNKVYVDKDENPEISWNGPLIVLINRNSASASEIFAGAIQDYSIGIVLGEPSYGKGTVQQIVDVNEFAPQADGKAGQLNLTIAKFYRIDGSSTQFKGIIPDLALPNPPNFKNIGEKSNKSALKWDVIKPTVYNAPKAVNNSLKNDLVGYFNKSVTNNPDYKVLLQNYQWFEKDKNDEKKISLHYDSLKKERKEDKIRSLKRTNETRKLKGLKTLKLGEKAPKNEKKTDLYIDESLKILYQWSLKRNNQ